MSRQINTRARAGTIIAVIACLAAARANAEEHAAWTKAPTEFRNVAFGASFAEAVAILGPMKCDSAVRDVADAKRCWTTDRDKAFKVNGKVVTTYYYFHRDNFVAVEMTQNAPTVYYPQKFENFFGPLVLAFQEKFGRATRASATSSEWANDAMRVSIAPRTESILTPYGDRMEVQLLGYAVIETQEWVKAKNAAQAAKVVPF